MVVYVFAVGYCELVSTVSDKLGFKGTSASLKMTAEMDHTQDHKKLR